MPQTVDFAKDFKELCYLGSRIDSNFRAIAAGYGVVSREIFLSKLNNFIAKYNNDAILQPEFEQQVLAYFYSASYSQARFTELSLFINSLSNRYEAARLVSTSNAQMTADLQAFDGICQNILRIFARSFATNNQYHVLCNYWLVEAFFCGDLNISTNLYQAFLDELVKVNQPQVIFTCLNTEYTINFDFYAHHLATKPYIILDAADAYIHANWLLDLYDYVSIEQKREITVWLAKLLEANEYLKHPIANLESEHLFESIRIMIFNIFAEQSAESDKLKDYYVEYFKNNNIMDRFSTDMLISFSKSILLYEDGHELLRRLFDTMVGEEKTARCSELIDVLRENKTPQVWQTCITILADMLDFGPQAFEILVDEDDETKLIQIQEISDTLAKHLENKTNWTAVDVYRMRNVVFLDNGNTRFNLFLNQIPVEHQNSVMMHLFEDIGESNEGVHQLVTDFYAQHVLQDKRFTLTAQGKYEWMVIFAKLMDYSYRIDIIDYLRDLIANCDITDVLSHRSGISQDAEFHRILCVILLGYYCIDGGMDKVLSLGKKVEITKHVKSLSNTDKCAIINMLATSLERKSEADSAAVISLCDMIFDDLSAENNMLLKMAIKDKHFDLFRFLLHNSNVLQRLDLRTVNYVLNINDEYSQELRTILGLSPAVKRIQDVIRDPLTYCDMLATFQQIAITNIIYMNELENSQGYRRADNTESSMIGAATAVKFMQKVREYLVDEDVNIPIESLDSSLKEIRRLILNYIFNEDSKSEPATELEKFVDANREGLINAVVEIDSQLLEQERSEQNTYIMAWLWINRPVRQLVRHFQYPNSSFRMMDEQDMLAICQPQDEVAYSELYTHATIDLLRLAVTVTRDPSLTAEKLEEVRFHLVQQIAGAQISNNSDTTQFSQDALSCIYGMLSRFIEAIQKHPKFALTQHELVKKTIQDLIESILRNFIRAIETLDAEPVQARQERMLYYTEAIATTIPEGIYRVLADNTQHIPTFRSTNVKLVDKTTNVITDGMIADRNRIYANHPIFSDRSRLEAYVIAELEKTNPDQQIVLSDEDKKYIDFISYCIVPDLNARVRLFDVYAESLESLNQREKENILIASISENLGKVQSASSLDSVMKMRINVASLKSSIRSLLELYCTRAEAQDKGFREELIEAATDVLNDKLDPIVLNTFKGSTVEQLVNLCKVAAEEQTTKLRSEHQLQDKKSRNKTL